VAGRARLRLLVLVVREAQVDAAAVDVELRPEVLAAIAEHSMCQPGRPGPTASARTRSPARPPCASLPEGEVARVALAARVGVLGGSMSSIRWWVSSPYAATTARRSRRRPSRRRRVGVPARDQLVDQLDHLGDVPGGRGSYVGGSTLRTSYAGQLALVGVGEVEPRAALLGGLGQDLVVDVGDVADERDVVAGPLEPARSTSKFDLLADVPDVRLATAR
jgi:hypothetical protein